MGMVLALTMTDDEAIGKTLADPALIWQLLAPDDPSLYEEERKSSSSWFSRLFGKQKPLLETATPLRGVEEIDLDKSWHGIHYLLTGTESSGEYPWNFLVLGGTEVGDIDVGYGRARAFRSDAVKEISRALTEIDQAELRRRYDPIEMTKLGIYPDIWNRDADKEENLSYCLEYFDDLKEFVARAAEKHLGIVISLQ